MRTLDIITLIYAAGAFCFSFLARWFLTTRQREWREEQLRLGVPFVDIGTAAIGFGLLWPYAITRIIWRAMTQKEELND